MDFILDSIPIMLIDYTLTFKHDWILAGKDTSMLPSKIDPMKVSHETGSEDNFGFRHALMPSYLGMLPPKAAFFSFRMQPMFNKLAKHEGERAQYKGS